MRSPISLRAVARVLVPGIALAVTLTGCSGQSSGSATSSAAGGSSAWSTPKDVIDGVTAAGFDCAAPSASPSAQVLTTDPFTGKDLGGNALIRCKDVQVMLAKSSVDEGFALLVACQVVPASIRQSPEWTTPVVEGTNFLILPVDLTSGWAAKAQPADFVKRFNGKQSTFGEIYDRACAGKEASAAPSGSTGSSAQPAPSGS